MNLPGTWEKMVARNLGVNALNLALIAAERQDCGYNRKGAWFRAAGDGEAWGDFADH